MSQRIDGIDHWLIHHAARRAPDSLSQRLEEEWLADMAERPSALSRLRFALGCCWATQVIAVEFEPSRVPVSSPAIAGRLMGAYAQHDSGYFSRRSGTLFLVVSLHALLFYGLITTVSRIHVSAADPLQNQPPKDPLPHAMPFRLPDPLLNDIKIQVPKADFDFPREPDLGTDVSTEIRPQPSPPSTAGSPSQAVTQVLGGPGAGFPNPDDFYPALARNLEEQGIATVKVCVDARGRLTSDPATVQGTGSARLDEGALKLARAGSGHYRPTTENGQPVNSCYAFRVRFQLRN
jgi:TonB family protein